MNVAPRPSPGFCRRQVQRCVRVNRRPRGRRPRLGFVGRKLLSGVAGRSLAGACPESTFTIGAPHRPASGMARDTTVDAHRSFQPTVAYGHPLCAIAHRPPPPTPSMRRRTGLAVPDLGSVSASLRNGVEIEWVRRPRKLPRSNPAPHSDARHRHPVRDDLREPDEADFRQSSEAGAR